MDLKRRVGFAPKGEKLCFMVGKLVEICLFYEKFLVMVW